MSKDVPEHLKVLHLQDGDLLVLSYDPEGEFPADLVDSLRYWLDSHGYRDVGVLVTTSKISLDRVPAEHLRHLGWEKRK